MLKGDYEGAKAAAIRFSEIFPKRFYLEIQNHGIPEEVANIQNMKKLASELNLPLVCTNDAHYAKKEHSEAHDIHICLGTGKIRSDPNRLRYATPESHILIYLDHFLFFPFLNIYECRELQSALSLRNEHHWYKQEED